MGSVEANKTVDLFLINKLVEQYMAVMRTTLSSKNILSKTILNDIHIKQKSYFFTTFKESRKSNDITIIDQLNSHFNQYFSSAFNEINEENEWRNFYKSILNESKTSYLNQIKKLFIDKSFYFVEEFHKLNDSIKTRIIDEIKNKTPKSPDVKFDEYIAQLVLFMNEEFNHFVEDNKMRRDSHENLIKVKFNELLEEYDNQMEKVANLVDCELDLSLKHIDNKMNVIKEFSSLNTSSDKTFFETYSAKLEQSIDKRLSGVIEYWKDQMNEQKKLKQIEKTKSAKLIEMAIKYYREEIDKSYQNTLFIATEKLEKINVKIVKHIIAKYESTKERGNMAYDEYEKLIRDSLNVIFDEIKEKNHSNTPTLKAIGIDLGTTNSCVAYYQPLKPNGKVNVIENGSGRYTTPSYVAFNDSGQVIAGHLAKSGAFANHRNTIYSVKRLIGRQYRDEEVQNDIKFWPFKVVDDGYNNPKISVKVNGTENTYTPEEISAKVLEKMKGVAEEKLGFTVRNAVITVPAYFSEAQKQATIKAGGKAGLNVLKIITEPTAAAIAYQLNRGDDRELKKVLIYDFGGGTFDVSILVIDNRKIEVKAHGGDNHLGGDDIDNNIMQYCLQQFYAKTRLKLDKSTEDLDLNRLRDTCEEKKCQLSEIDSVTIEIKAFIGTQDLKVELTREKLEELNYHLFLKSMNCVEYVLNEAKLSHQDIDDIVLVGGTTRIPRVREMLSDLFDGKQLSNAINPDEAVAIGAAIQAAILNGVEAQNLGHLKVLDVAPMSLGVKVKDGFMSNIIDRNTKIPNKYIKQYTTSSDYQKEILVEVYEGEETMAVDNRLLGTFTLRNIPSEPKGVPLIDVSFEVNDEGKLDVKAKIAGSDEEEGIQITEHRGRLTDTQLQQLIKEYTQNLNL